MKQILIATRNAHKTEEIQAMLGSGYQVSDLTSQPDLPEVDETGTTFLENATLKAVEISQLVDGLIISDDSGLEVDALGGDPGVYSARYAGEDGNDAANNAKLLTELAKLPDDTVRSARFRCVIVVAKNGERLAHFDGTVEGRILDAEYGDNGFGYDPMFAPAGHDQTFGQLGEEIKNGMSHRANAMQPLISWLKENY
ncbi:RdgB/HAM1 family non-canonical purine NTP pyrophosphatase [Persicirhabdus sediminis]|uniref:dITP/XTP pyrophosphatase n=1 Tax=Persicirhabdus sediminis TaxID=454144 RepID=A0A8J7MDQ2_9BACT|nr:RdgB/HAM1 family non-canonical purine NTP pyrophosphatase [Persicirhabdus sediminis]MBK1790786.1 RdgB/HAM1 family non-canonical purine NTP pyrophosphatase [Persicirhabdus sediminis]